MRHKRLNIERLAVNLDSAILRQAKARAGYMNWSITRLLEDALSAYLHSDDKDVQDALKLLNEKQSIAVK